MKYSPLQTLRSERTKPEPVKSRAHDYIITPQGRLALRPPAPVDKRLERIADMRDKRKQEREADEPVSPKEQAFYEPVPGATWQEPEPPKPEAELRQALSQFKPPTPSRHDELSVQVAELVRQGKSYSEAMDIVLDGGA